WAGPIARRLGAGKGKQFSPRTTARDGTPGGPGRPFPRLGKNARLAMVRSAAAGRGGCAPRRGVRRGPRGRVVVLGELGGDAMKTRRRIALLASSAFVLQGLMAQLPAKADDDLAGFVTWRLPLGGADQD